MDPDAMQQTLDLAKQYVQLDDSAAAEKLQISLVTLDNWTKLGVINARKIGSRVYYTDSDINNALKKSFKE